MEPILRQDGEPGRASNERARCPGSRVLGMSFKGKVGNMETEDKLRITHTHTMTQELMVVKK